MKVWGKIWPILLIFGVLGAIFGASAYSGSHKTREDLLHQQEIINNQQVHKLVPMGKPVIYLYPEEKTEVAVKLDYDGELTATYPNYRNGWQVMAMPDGTLYDRFDGREYSYLFWEGTCPGAYDLSKGFVVKGEDTKDFLQEKLAFLGLTPREYNEFIVYWMPLMQDHPYNLISFQQEAYTDLARLDISPAPDSILRVFMAYQPLDEPIEMEPQQLEPFIRTGFTVVEWGGAQING